MVRQYEYRKHHQEEREHHQEECKCKKDERKQHEQAQETQIGTIHPAWFVIPGVILIASVVVLWAIP